MSVERSLTDTARRWSIGFLVGPCSMDEATVLLEDLFDASGGRLGAVGSLGPWPEKDALADESQRVLLLQAELAALRYLIIRADGGTRQPIDLNYVALLKNDWEDITRAASPHPERNQT